MKKSFFYVIASLVIAVFVSTSANAAWIADCTVVATGVEASTGVTYITLQNAGWTGNRNYTIPSGTNSNTLLAIALSAATSGKTISISAINTTIYSLFMNQ